MLYTLNRKLEINVTWECQVYILFWVREFDNGMYLLNIDVSTAMLTK